MSGVTPPVRMRRSCTSSASFGRDMHSAACSSVPSSTPFASGRDARAFHTALVSAAAARQNVPEGARIESRDVPHAAQELALKELQHLRNLVVYRHEHVDGAVVLHEQQLRRPLACAVVAPAQHRHAHHLARRVVLGAQQEALPAVARGVCGERGRAADVLEGL